MKSKSSLAGLLLLPLLLAVAASVPGHDDCWVCRKPIMSAVYMWMDEVAGVKRHVCELCAELPNSCYMCSLPVKTNASNLRDGRYLCARDVKSVLLDDEKILSICHEAGPTLDRLLSRYMTFPTNVSFQVADRQTMVELFKIPGKDYTCPNVLGFTDRETNEQQQVKFPISILSGQTPAATEATCAHELTHAWMLANLTPARQKELNRDSVEGFCELIAYLTLREKHEAAQIAALRTNRYTRGQIDLFIDAEERFGFSDVLDWMRNGATNRLSAEEVWRVRDLKIAKASGSNAVLSLTAFTPAPLPEHLVLKSISLGGKTPTALINQCTLGVGETGRVKLATTNLMIRCRAIHKDSVVVEVVGSGKTEELHFQSSAIKSSGK